jgi:hypothetical protein
MQQNKTKQESYSAVENFNTHQGKLLLRNQDTIPYISSLRGGSVEERKQNIAECNVNTG